MSTSTSKFAGVIAAAFAAVSSTAVLADKTYVSDQGHTEVLFGWSHVGITRQNGEFTESKAVLNLADNIADSSVSVEIQTDSLSSGFGALDDHLKTEDFLEVETYPTITFESTSVEMDGDTKMAITGDLTIHGVTKSVVLQAEMTLNGKHPLGGRIDYYKGDWVAFNASTEIDHQEFDVGGFSTGPIAITINTEMKAE